MININLISSSIKFCVSYNNFKIRKLAHIFLPHKQKLTSENLLRCITFLGSRQAPGRGVSQSRLGGGGYPSPGQRYPRTGYPKLTRTRVPPSQDRDTLQPGLGYLPPAAQPLLGGTPVLAKRVPQSWLGTSCGLTQEDFLV